MESREDKFADPKPVRKFRPEKVPVDSRFPEVDLPEPPYDIEVGCGVGYHPVRYALANPDRTLLAIERTHERFRKFLGRIEGNHVGGNLIPIQSDALFWIVHHIPRESVQRYFFLYPNPFPRHRRWYAMPFMEYVVDTMMEGGTLQMATNIEEYYEEAKRYFVSIWKLEKIEDRLIEGNEPPRTHFEKKYLERGERCWNLTFRKRYADEEVEFEEEGSLVEYPAESPTHTLEVRDDKIIAEPLGVAVDSSLPPKRKMPPLPKLDKY